MKAAAPIGMFDSGLGGLSIWQAVRDLLPYEPIYYFADQAHCPYGPRPAAEIQNLADSITRFLLAQGCKMMVVACNTATAAAISLLRERYPVPFVGLEPALKPAAIATRSGKIGILATEGTFRGGHFQRTREAYASDTELLLQVGEGLVRQVEKGELDTPETEKLLRSYLEPMLAAGADQIVLGCTHYPFLAATMEKIVAGRAEIVNPAGPVALQVARRLAEIDALTGINDTEDRFFTSGDAAQFTSQLAELLGPVNKPRKVAVIDH